MGWQIIAVDGDYIVRARRSSPSMIGGICNSYHFIQNADRMHGPKETGVDSHDRASLVRVLAVVVRIHWKRASKSQRELSPSLQCAGVLQYSCLFRQEATRARSSTEERWSLALSACLRNFEKKISDR